MTDSESDRSERLLTIEDLERSLGLSCVTIRRMAHAGDLPKGFFIGRSRRWRQSEIDGYISNLAGAKKR